MKRRLLMALIGLVACIANGMLASAQDLEVGTWIGKLRLPDGSAQRIRLVVEEFEKDSQQLTLLSGDSMYPCTDVRLKDLQLSFSWTPGDQPVLCTLQWQDYDNFEGNCMPPGDDSKVEIVLIPPKKAGSIENDAEETNKPSE